MTTAAITPVTLQINKATLPNPPGPWKQSSNSNFIYKYAGGNPNSNQPTGSFNFSGDDESVNILLTGSPNYAISTINISYDDGSDQELTKTQNQDGSWTISHDDTDQESGNYSVFVSYTDNSTNPPTVTNNIECDPRWQAT